MSPYFNTVQLLTGQTAPFTGGWVDVGRSRENLYSSFGTASGSITLQYRSPFFIEQGITFYNVILSGSGYAEPVFSTSPMGEVRAISAGSGKYWCAMTQQN